MPPPTSTPPRPLRPIQPQPTTFSTTQRSAQARAKPFARETDGQDYEDTRKREHALAILESAEMLIWWSGARNESIPQTRQHYLNIVWGVQDEEVEWREEWDVDSEREGVKSPRSAKGKEKAGEAEKRRVSSGSGKRRGARSVQGSGSGVGEG